MRDRTWMKPDRKWGTIRISRVRGDHKHTLCEGKKIYFSIEEKIERIRKEWHMSLPEPCLLSKI